MAAWAHANSTPGDPTIGPIPNSADMVTGGYRHWFDRKTTVYLAYARMMNGDGAHYALGPSGHGVTWDYKDGSGPATGGAVSGSGAGPVPGIGLIGNGTQCFTGTNIQAFSAGMTYDF